ncbi:MAG: tyrosine-type recombinase/integrase [Candidatus Bathyarchaeota archaeon]|nr:tyrosine-type recombinase/integrase [Candidatus Bathyarchaeota archaeon]MDH5747081.1 tyrosine-type recombinase/integrase [Candidatus Bathyarchaeota archaeon]
MLQCKNNGLAGSTLKSIASSFRQISKTADLNNPESVKTFIANLKLSNNTKQKHANNYNHYCKINGIKWEKPYYKSERKIPLIPTTENVNKIIAASSRKYAAIFTILKETGLEGMELATMPRTQIDADRGIINAEGCKGHNSRSFKLKQATADLLRTYLAKYKGNYPFPRSKIMGQMWREFRDRLAEKLNDPQLKAIPLRNLRHYYATRLYAKTKDILLVKQRLGHKKLETTMFYTQLIHYNEEEEYTCKTATTIKEATDLIEHGFEYITEMDDLKLFRKRK